MELIGFIVIALLWAAFLLPSFFENRRQAPIATTRRFARSTALLASVAATSTEEMAARRIATTRRRRTLLVLAGGAFVTLAVAIWRSSVVWLGASLLFDVALAGFVTMLLYARQRRELAARTTVVLPTAEEAPARDPQRHTVRVVAS